MQQAERDRFTAFLVVAIVPLGEPEVIIELLVRPPGGAGGGGAAVGGPIPPGSGAAAGAGGAIASSTDAASAVLDPDSLSTTTDVLAWIKTTWQLSWLGVEQ